MLRHEIWREAEELERLRVGRSARGEPNDDLEDPLPDGSLDHRIADFGGVHNWTPRLSDISCEPLLARITREIQRNTHAVIPLDSVMGASETARGAEGKKHHRIRERLDTSRSWRPSIWPGTLKRTSWQFTSVSYCSKEAVLWQAMP